MQKGDLDKKNKGTHSSEIFKFEKYFKIPYDPLHIERIVREASEILKEKYDLAKERFHARPKHSSLLNLP